MKNPDSQQVGFHGLGYLRENADAPTALITFFTLGLFLLVINAIIILICDYFIAEFYVDGFINALLFSVLLSIIQSILNKIFIDQK